MIQRKEIQSVSIKQDNDARCFNSWSNDQRGSPHNKRAKRLASKRVRRFLRREDEHALAEASVVLAPLA